MEQHSVLKAQYPAFYNHPVMNRQRKELGLSIQEVARRCGINFETTRMVFHGRAMNRQAYVICRFLGLNWAQVHDLDLKEDDFHLAIQNGKENHSLGEEEAGTLVAEPAS